MQFILRKSSSNTGKVAGGGICSPKKPLEQINHKIYRRDPEVSSIILKHSDRRSAILIFVVVEPDECWNVLAPLIVPLQGSGHLGCGADVKVEGFDKQKSQTNHHLPDCKCHAKSTASSSSCGLNSLLQSQNRDSVNCDLSNDSSGSGHDGFLSTSSADFVKSVNKPIKKSSRKKLKKKGRRQKKASRTTDIAVLGEQGIRDISALDTCSNSVSTLGDGCSVESNLSENAMPFSVSPHEDTKGNFNNEESSSDSVNLSATISKATSCSDDLELLETAASLPQNSAGDDFSSYLPSADETSQVAPINTTQPVKVTLSDLNGVVLDAYLKQRGTLPDITSGLPSDKCSAPVNGCNRYGNVVYSKPPFRKENGTHPCDDALVSDCNNCGTSFHDVTSGKGHSTYGTSHYSSIRTANSDSNACNVVGNTDNSPDGARYGIEDTSSSSDGFTVISRKKGGRRTKKSLVSSDGTYKVSNDVDAHGWSGKESDVSFWQKVQKTAVGRCFFVPKDKDSVCLQFDASNRGSLSSGHYTFAGLTEKVHENSTKSACLDEISTQARTDAKPSSPKLEYRCSNNKISEKLKRDCGSESKGDSIQNSRNISHTGKATLAWPTKMNLPQKEAHDISLVGNNYNRFGSGLRSSCSPTNSLNHFSSEPLCYLEAHPEKARLLENVITQRSDVNGQDSQNQTNTLPEASDFMVQFEQLEVESVKSSKFPMDKPGDSCTHACNENGPTELGTYVCQVENSKPNSSCGNFSFSHLDDQFSHRWNLNSTEEEKKSFLPFNAGVTCLGSRSGNSNYTKSGDEVTYERRLYAPGMPKGCVHIPSSYQPMHKTSVQDISEDETHSSKISQAVNDAYRMQIESEGIEMATGCPLAEYEKLLHSASPVLEQTCNIQCCNACVRDQLVSDFLCRHQMPKVTLGSLWQWYEMIGSYGLEVKVEDCYNTKRFGSDHFQCCAYFVPFLSAVQLFGRSSSSIHASKVVTNAEFTNTYDMDATSEYSSHVGGQHVFSVQSLRSHREEETGLSVPVNLLSTSNSSSASDQDEMRKQPVSSACTGDPKLVFEYFECERPCQRRPLFEKIQELASENVTSNSQISGDPRKLICLNLQDLHPSSWYSVAWYPIYRIPDGNFRAAFLTYHSLGHFIHRSASSNSLGEDASIVSPVVGMQSYNAQGECWFQLRNLMTQMEGSLRPNPSEVLKERLRTLEQTAHVMARASFFKGDKKFINRQSDYEFFLSRRR